MNKDARNNIAAAFVANKDAKQFHADENGHCFTNPTNEVVTEVVSREDFEKEIEELEKEVTSNEGVAVKTTETITTETKTTKTKK